MIANSYESNNVLYIFLNLATPNFKFNFKHLFNLINQIWLFVNYEHISTIIKQLKS